MFYLFYLIFIIIINSIILIFYNVFLFHILICDLSLQGVQYS